MNIDLDEILDTPVQTSLFVDCFDDLMDSLSSDFPMNDEFDSILADLHQSSTVLTPEPSPLEHQNDVSVKNPVNDQQIAEDEKHLETISNILQTELLSYTTLDEGTFPNVSTSLEQFDAMMYLSGNSPPSEQYQPYESSSYELLPTIYPPDIIDAGSTQQEETKLINSESSEPQEQTHQNSVTQQTLVVESAGQQFEIGISFSIPSELPTVELPIQDAYSSAQQALTINPSLPQLNWVQSQEPAGSSESIPQVQWTLATQPTSENTTPLILPLPNNDECKKISDSVVPCNNSNNSSAATLQISSGNPVITNYHDNYQKWLKRSTIQNQQATHAAQNLKNFKVIKIPDTSVKADSKIVDQMIIEEQPATPEVESVRNYVHIPSSYIIKTDGTSKTFIVHEVYKVTESKKRTATAQEPLHELSEPNRKRPRKSNVIYDTDFLCIPCQKTFGKKGSLKQHIRSYHSEPLPFHCDTCGKNFATEAQLQRHVVNHDQRNKKFQCSDCDKRYVHSKDRDRHYLSHHGVPTHACRQCSMAFVRRDHLLAHELTHERRQSRQALILNARKVQ